MASRSSGSTSSQKLHRAERKAQRAIRKAEKKAVKARAKAEAKIEKKAAKTRAKFEAKVSAKQEKKLQKQALREEHKYLKKNQKAERKTAKAAGKAQEKAHAAEAKTIAAQAKAAEKQGLFTPAKIRRYLTVGRMVAPIAGPILYRGAVAARAQVTELQARKAGVPASLLNQYGGPSAATRARIAAAQNSAEQVEARETTSEGRQFVAAMRARLDNLVVATDAADTMPPAQRRAAQRAIDNELSAIDNDLLARLNVHP